MDSRSSYLTISKLVFGKMCNLAEKGRNMLQIGDKMPAFEVLDQDGNTVTSQDLIKTGKKTIVYFYPKDNTSGCIFDKR